MKKKYLVESNDNILQAIARCNPAYNIISGEIMLGLPELETILDFLGSRIVSEEKSRFKGVRLIEISEPTRKFSDQEEFLLGQLKKTRAMEEVHVEACDFLSMYGRDEHEEDMVVFFGPIFGTIEAIVVDKNYSLEEFLFDNAILDDNETILHNGRIVNSQKERENIILNKWDDILIIPVPREGVVKVNFKERKWKKTKTELSIFIDSVSLNFMGDFPLMKAELDSKVVARQSRVLVNGLEGRIFILRDKCSIPFVGNSQTYELPINGILGILPDFPKDKKKNREYCGRDNLSVIEELIDKQFRYNGNKDNAYEGVFFGRPFVSKEDPMRYTPPNFEEECVLLENEVRRDSSYLSDKGEMDDSYIIPEPYGSEVIFRI